MKPSLKILLICLLLTLSCSSYQLKKEAEGRKQLAEFSQSQAIKEGSHITFSVSGEGNTILTIKDATYTENAAKTVMANPESMQPFREAKFKQIIFTNGIDEWKVYVK